MTLLFMGLDAWAGPRLEAVRARGMLRCGISPTLPGFAQRDADDSYRGFDVDLCRAVATAILGEPARVDFLPAGTVEAFQREDRLDLVSRQLTWTLQREALPGIAFGPVVFHDGLALLVRSRSSLRQPRQPRQLADQPVCVVGGTTAEAGLLAWFERQRLPVRALQFDTAESALAAFRAGSCRALAADLSQLAGWRHRDERLLPELLTHEPIAPLLHEDDREFARIVAWTVYALIAAEELGITAEVARQPVQSRDARIRRWLGETPEAGRALGLAPDWARHVIAAVGNYGEIYARHFGPRGLDLPRGRNALATQGGLLYAPPLQ